MSSSPERLRASVRCRSVTRSPWRSKASDVWPTGWSRVPDPGPVRLRVAPSPTGDPHVGTADMSLFNLAFVRQPAAQFVLRIEATDRARYREDSEQQVYVRLHWLHPDWDEGPDRGGPF